MSQKKDKDMLDARAKRKEKLKEAIGVIRNTVGVSTWSIKVASKEREGLVCEVEKETSTGDLDPYTLLPVRRSLANIKVERDVKLSIAMYLNYTHGGIDDLVVKLQREGTYSLGIYPNSLIEDFHVIEQYVELLIIEVAEEIAVRQKQEAEEAKPYLEIIRKHVEKEESE